MECSRNLYREADRLKGTGKPQKTANLKTSVLSAFKNSLFLRSFAKAPARTAGGDNGKARSPLRGPRQFHSGTYVPQGRPRKSPCGLKSTPFAYEADTIITKRRKSLFAKSSDTPRPAKRKRGRTRQAVPSPVTTPRNHRKGSIACKSRQNSYRLLKFFTRRANRNFPRPKFKRACVATATRKTPCFGGTRSKFSFPRPKKRGAFL